jgi:hypothetical protein
MQRIVALPARHQQGDQGRGHQTGISALQDLLPITFLQMPVVRQVRQPYLHTMKCIATLLLGMGVVVAAHAQTAIAAKDAKAHIGETVTVIDTVYGGKLLSSNMTLIDVGGRYPHELLTIMIPAADRSKFSGSPETDWKGKAVSVTGKIIDYKGKPEIVIEELAGVSVK